MPAVFSHGSPRGVARQGGPHFFSCARYIRLQRPRVFILENVKGLLTTHQGTCFLETLRVLWDIGGCNIYWSVLNTREHGVPQNRPRLYIVGCCRTFDSGHFRFPEALPPRALGDFLENRSGRPSWSQMPQPHGCNAYNNVVTSIRHLEHLGHDPFREPFVVNCDSSSSRASTMLDCSPCITRSRYRGHWLCNRGRRMSLGEMWRLQGLPEEWMPLGLPADILGRQLGNGMSGNVLERLFCRIFRAFGMPLVVNVVDRHACSAEERRRAAHTPCRASVLCSGAADTDSSSDFDWISVAMMSFIHAYAMFDLHFVTPSLPLHTFESRTLCRSLCNS